LDHILTAKAIRELDFVKKGVSMMATNARQSIRFIEKVLSYENSHISQKIIHEDANEPGPGWSKCIQYKTCSPKVSEFVNAYKSIRPTRDEDEALDGTNKALARNKGRKERAIMPARLKYLIMPCVKKIHLDPEDWKLITEDECTRIWAQSFDIPCVNISQAEIFLFNKKHNIAAPEPKNRTKALAKRLLENVPRIAKFDSTEFAPRGTGELWAP
jgi:hypothetical protein